MRADVERLQQSEWIDHFATQNYEGEWTALPLRAPANARHPIETIYSDPASHSFVDTPLLEQCAYLRQVLGAFACPLEAVRLLRLAPGSRIKPHADHDLAPELGRVRLHIPITTSADVDFRLNGAPVTMREGECWYLRLSETHSVVNRGAADRVHLVIDAVLNPWLDAELRTAEESTPQDPPEERASPFDQLRGLVLQDPALQRRLHNIEERESFIAAVMEVASETGHAITRAQIDEAMRERRRRWLERRA